MRALQYAFDEAVTSLKRGRRSAALSIGTIALAFFVLGAFLIVTVNLERLVAEWRSTADMSVYLSDEIMPAELSAIESALAPGAGSVVASREHVSKAEALIRFKQTFAELAASIGTLGDNPLPASFNVRLLPNATSGAVENFGNTLRRMSGVADVRYDRQWLDRLLTAISVVRGVGFGLAVVLTLAAAFTVATVVRLALIARRDEMLIMDLVGAPMAYVRGPFVMEGVLQGGLGALVALAVLALTFFSLRAHYLAPLASAFNLASVHFLPFELSILLVLGGMTVGCAGGLVVAWGR